MRQSDRLLHLLEALRTLPSPATDEQLVSTTGVSIRLVYRDIETLRAGGGEVVTAKKQ